MKPDIPTAVKITALNSEMDIIHFANSSYWGGTSEARAEYQRRQDRLEEIRAELAQLRSD